jgi:hypothetical protein
MIAVLTNNARNLMGDPPFAILKEFIRAVGSLGIEHLE